MKKLATKYWIFLGTLPPAIIFDQWTKQMVLDRFRLGESYTIIQDIFDFTYVRNRGAAFGMLQNLPPAIRDPFFLTVPFIALAIIGVVYYRLRSNQKWVATALSLIFAGAIGNLIDRIRFGYVVDFIDVHWKEVYHWPAFNIADSCIVVGVFMMFIDSFLQMREEKAAKETTSNTE